MGGEGATERKSTASHGLPLLHTRALMRRTPANRVFAVVYLCVILALLYHHFIALLHSTSILSLLILLADAVLAFMWVTSLAFRMCPTERQVFIEHLEHYAKESEYPALDVFICTADPFKEPPIDVVNTALSVMAYDYPIEKLSVYVSDDGGSQLTLFAFMEAARFATHWLPYCKINKIVERCPEAYFASNPSWFPETDQIKVLLERGKDKDITGHDMPNLVYISREKRMDSPHHFKAGALNVLLRVSATMTNAPVILTLDGDMYSNDPQTPLRVLCYLLDPSMDPKLGYVQFPQIFHGINKSDIYDGELRHVYQVQLSGMDGLAGPQLVGSGSFFRRKIFFGGPSETPEMNQDQLTSKSIRSKEVLAMAHHVAGCNFGNQTKWGTKMGFRYGSLVEDLHTSYQLQSGSAQFHLNLPKGMYLIHDPWFFVNVFLFLGAYGQDYLEFILSGGTTLRWWNNQRMWMMRGLSSFPFGWIEYFLKSMGISTFGFNVTSKVVQEEQSKRYKEGIFDFGVASPLFLPLTTAAIINLASFLKGIALVFKQGGLEDLLLQMLLAGFGIVNCWPIYEAMVLRTDEGKLPVKITLISIVLAWALY
ncbi:Cellulose synthase-like protein G2 [Vitis vinifera]|uniref:Cellulose synthase-like protein G2 n=1 Tax=Vitis vinifera TaxID=29760 RepID=A0A438BV34_VITVI|nr:Cellulose synthase-like protein G2 [Vitis vinifera]